MGRMALLCCFLRVDMCALQVIVPWGDISAWLVLAVKEGGVGVVHDKMI